MSYKYYNNNPLARFSPDCVIRSVPCALNKSWDSIYDYLSDLAQAEGTLFDKRDFVRKFLDDNFVRLPKFEGTVGEASWLLFDKIALITMPGHITCSKYGVIYDTFDCRDRIVEDIWLVER